MKTILSVGYLVSSYFILYTSVNNINEHESPWVIALGIFVAIGFIVKGFDLSK